MDKTTKAEPGFAQLKETLNSSKSVFVLLPQNPSFDATAAALALYLSLKEAKKNVTIGSSSQMRVEFGQLIGINKITNKLGNRNLIISFDYQEDSIEKVSYNVEGQKFNLVIQPRSGFPPLDEKSVSFSYEGIEADLMFIIGAVKLESLGQIYERERQAFSNTTVVNIDRNPSNTKYGQINLVDPKTASICEILFKLLVSHSLPVNIDIASNLLRGIEIQTQNFQTPFATASTFEIVSELMKHGAKRSAPAAGRQWVPRQVTPPVSRIGMSLRQSVASPAFPAVSQGTQPRPSQIMPGITLGAAPLQAQSLMGQSSFPVQPPARQPLQPAAVSPLVQPQAVDPNQQTQTNQPQSAVSPAQVSKSKNSQNQKHFGRKSRKGKKQNQSQKDWIGPKIYQGKTKV